MKKTIIKLNVETKRRGIAKWVDKDFEKILNEIKQTRLTLNKDTFNSIPADWRITLAFARHPLTKKIKEDIIQATLK